MPRIAQTPDDPVVSWTMTKERWKRICDRGRVELYDTEIDLEKRHNRVLEYREVRRALERQLAEFRERTQVIDWESVELRLDPQTAEALRRIGYGD